MENVLRLETYGCVSSLNSLSVSSYVSVYHNQAAHVTQLRVERNLEFKYLKVPKYQNVADSSSSA